MLSADRGHVALAFLKLVRVDVVHFGLCLESDEQPFLQLVIAPAISEEFSYIDLFVREETGPDSAIRGQAEPVTLFTEMAADGADQSYFSNGALKLESHGRSIPSVRWDGDQIANTFQTVFDLGDGQEVTFPPCFTIP